MKKYSIIVPVYNRPDEMEDLLESLAVQTVHNFELLVVEDGSSVPCKEVCDAYAEKFPITYFFKSNSGPGDSRNFGMGKAKGEYLLFFDSDCVIPPDYFEKVEAHLQKRPLDAYGGPDSADESFTDVQKAINYAMTSIFTTGGVRGKENKLDQFQPRSFNMGVRKEVYERVGGFGDIHPGEDPDWSYRIMNAGFRVGLIPEAFVYHKRRIDFSKFIKQVYKFGVVRVILMKWFPDKTKLTYFFPTAFLLGSVGLLLLGGLVSKLFWLPFTFLKILLFVDAFRLNKSLKIAVLAVLASFIQLYAYGWGFLKSFWRIKVLRIEERKAFPGFFFKK